jgi:beta-phosphoglucomutase-like phosphatase (HAD superfamily)
MVYTQVLERLRLPAEACVAFEDSENGLRAARAAGLQTVVTPTAFTAHHDFTGALRVLPTLEGVRPQDLSAWRGQPAPSLARAGAATCP